MNLLLGSESRILLYSNPDVEYKNKATGTSSDNNVARRLRETSATVESFRPYTPPFSVNISGPVKGDNNGTYTWSAIVSNGIPPYTYRWDYSYDGSNYAYFGNTSSITDQLPFDFDLYLKLTVTSSNGLQDIDFHTTINLGDHPHPLFEVLSPEQDTILTESVLKNANISADAINETENVSMNLIDWTIYPNPVSENTTIAFSVNQMNTVTIDILDLQGKKIQNVISQKYEKGFYTINISSLGLSQGTYLCRITEGEKVSSRKIIIK
jgi:hypothetical protein